MHPDIPPLLTTTEAARLCRVSKSAIKLWVHRGHLDYARDDQGQPLTRNGIRVFRQLDVARAEQATRAHAGRDLSLLVRIGAHA